ncbi:Uncharacterised protein [Mycobacteroides abscessus subsp. abscessus]|nr:Uncharacterised protein [Mycobacteroides abscessus subsp. abscessus]
MRSRALQNALTDLGATGEHRLVEALGQQFLGDVPVALDDDDGVRVQVLRKQLCHQCGTRWR